METLIEGFERTTCVYRIVWTRFDYGYLDWIFENYGIGLVCTHVCALNGSAKDKENDWGIVEKF